MARFWKTDVSNSVNPLVPDWRYFVEVCSFTFHFRSVEHIEQYLAHFSRKIHPSSADGAHTKRPDSDWRDWNSPVAHWERQSRFDELPLWLFEEPKRQKVVKALQRAIKEFSKDGASSK
ncbi:MAG: hypothetical protein KY445_15920 [Armatimonadetes bacterium]|nr:hypothetical protein [Armatimonadota bacterium]